MKRHRNFLETDKFPKVTQIFSSRKHLIFRSYQRDSLETHLTKRIKTKDEIMMDSYRTHIYSNVLPYLRKINYGSERFPLKMSESIADVMVQGRELEQISQEYDYDSQNEETTSNPEVDGLTLFLSKRMIQGRSLKEMVVKKDKRLDGQFCLDLVGNIVDFLLRSNGVRDLLITSDNIIVSNDGQFCLNYFSMVGFDFFKLDKYISRQQFEEILPYLTPQFVQLNSPGKCRIPFQMQLKFIMINFYSAFFRRDLSLDSASLGIQIEVRKNDEKVREAVKKVEEQVYPKLFPQKKQQNEHREVIKFDNQHHVRYSQLMLSCMKNKNIDNWQRALIYLSQRGQDEKKDTVQMYAKFDYYKIEGNQHKFAENSLEMIDAYLRVLGLMQKCKKIGGNKIKDVTKNHNQLEEEKNKLVKEERYSRSLYIPIKFGMRFTEILKYKNWVHLLNSAKDSDSQTLEAVKRLIGFCMQVRQDMILFQPHLNGHLLLSLIEQKKQIDDDLFDQSFYRFLKEQLKEEIQDRKIKEIFWEKFFWILNQLMLLSKSFFLRTTEQSLKQHKINRHDFSSIVKLIDTSTPHLACSEIQ